MIFDLQTIIVLAGMVIFFYVAYKVGAFVLKIAVGVLVIVLIAAVLTRFCSHLTGWL